MANSVAKQTYYLCTGSKVAHFECGSEFFFFLVVSDYRGWIASPIVTVSVTEKPYPVIFTFQRWFCLDREKCQEWSFLTAGWNSLTLKEFSPEVFVISLQFFLPPKTCLKIKQGVTCALSTSCRVLTQKPPGHRIHHVTSSWWSGMSSRSLSVGLIVYRPGHCSFSLNLLKEISSLMSKESWNKVQCDSLSANSPHLPQTRKIWSGLWEFSSFQKKSMRTLLISGACFYCCDGHYFTFKI